MRFAASTDSSLPWTRVSCPQEQSNVRGGVLADEMGMGKTIQAISVIVAHRWGAELQAKCRRSISGSLKAAVSAVVLCSPISPSAHITLVCPAPAWLPRFTPITCGAFDLQI